MRAESNLVENEEKESKKGQKDIVLKEQLGLGIFISMKCHYCGWLQQ